jgi:hypothetical protein
MSIVIRGDHDETLDAFADVLREYETLHRRARIEAYRLDPASIRVRIIDPDFEGFDRAKRHEDVWRYLDGLPDDVLSHLSLLLLLTPREKKTSFASAEFDAPVASAS